MKFQNPNIHRLKLSNFTEMWKNHSKFQNSVILSKYEVTFSKVNQVIYSSAKISIPNIKAISNTFFEISCTQDFKYCFQRDITQKRGITWA